MPDERDGRYRLLFEEVPCYISIQDRDLRIVEANRRFREDFGDRLGSLCHEVYKHRPDPCLDCPVQRCFDDGQVHRSEEVVTSLGGERMNVLVYAAPIRDDHGDIRYVMEMSTNITPVRQLQSQLESVGLLISSISHGIKGLLTGLDGGRYLVNSALKKNDPERLRKGWEMVERNVDRIRGMVLNILYYAKERVPQWEAVDATVLVREVAGLVENRARELGVDLQVEVTAEAGTFEADPRAVRAMLVNLVENALDACRIDPHKPAHQVRIRVGGRGTGGWSIPIPDCRADTVRFEITDNGIGMDTETRDKAFTLFFSSKGTEGTGLGLFIAHSITQAHGGHIHLDSEPGLGTTFLVDLPRERSGRSSEAVRPVPRTPPDSPAPAPLSIAEVTVPAVAVQVPGWRVHVARLASVGSSDEGPLRSAIRGTLGRIGQETAPWRTAAPAVARLLGAPGTAEVLATAIVRGGAFPEGSGPERLAALLSLETGVPCFALDLEEARPGMVLRHDGRRRTVLAVRDRVLADLAGGPTVRAGDSPEVVIAGVVPEEVFAPVGIKSVLARLLLATGTYRFVSEKTFSGT